MNSIANWDNTQLQNEYKRLVQQGWERELKIAKRTERHTGIDFTNKNFNRYLSELEKEMKNRGLK